MEVTDPSSYHHPPAAQHHLNLHQHQHQHQDQQQQPPPLLSQPDSSSLSHFPNPNPNPNPIHAFDNSLPSSSSAAAAGASDFLQPPGVDPYLYDPYATHLVYDGSHSIASQSYAQMPASYYYQHQQQYAPNLNTFSYGVGGTGNTTADLESKKRKVIAEGAAPDSVRVCSICDVVCNSDTVFARHLAGEKHALKAFGISSNALKPKVPAHKKALHLTKKATLLGPRMTPKTAAKNASKGLIAFVQSSYCDVCKIDCNSQEVLNNHRRGRKHIKNLQKLQEVIKPKPATNPAKNSTQIANPGASESKAVNEQSKKNASPAAKEDLETKKRKVLSGGAAADAVRVCTYCNVVCNSDLVYSFHIAGKKHTAMMNKQKQTAPVS